MNNIALRNIAFVCVLVIFLITLMQSSFGGTMFTVTVKLDHYFLFDHGRYTEITFGQLIFLAMLSGIAVLAFIIGATSVVCLVVRMRKSGTHDNLFAVRKEIQRFWEQHSKK